MADLTLTDAQTRAAQRRAVGGAVYLLSGTVPSRVSGVADLDFRWATRSFEGGPTAGEQWERFLVDPRSITREVPFRPGEQTPLFSYDIPVRNVPLLGRDTTLAVLVDGTFAFEGAKASLYVGYLNPGQRPEDLAPGDWTLLRQRGEFGAPTSIDVDGFVLPLNSPEISRRKRFNLREATKEDFPNIDPADIGKVIPVGCGRPNGWVRALRTNAGWYGTLTSTTSPSDTEIEITDEGFDIDAFGQGPVIPSNFYLYRSDTIIKALSGTRLDNGLIRLHLASGVGAEIPNGAVAQEKRGVYRFAAANHFALPWEVALELNDGRVIPIDLTGTTQTFFTNDDKALGYDDAGSFEQRRTDIIIDDILQPPVFVPAINAPASGVAVTKEDVSQQPEFNSTSTVQATKVNVPTGPAFAFAAFDGSTDTGYFISTGSPNQVTFTFGTLGLGEFSINDTIKSTILLTAAVGGISPSIVVEAPAGSVRFNLTSATGGPTTYRLVLNTTVAYNASIRFAAASGNITIYEVAWEHELEGEIDLNRSTDTEIDVEVAGSGGDDGLIMEPIRAVVYKANFAAGGSPIGANVGTSSQDKGPLGGLVAGPGFVEQNGISDDGAEDWVTPARVFADLQRFLIEDNDGKSSLDRTNYSEFVNVASYEAAHERYKALGIEFSFVLDKPVAWEDLEEQLALQCRSHAFYGPQGHELVVLEDAATLAEVTPSQVFVLPGVEGTNVAPSSSALLARTGVSDIFNTAKAYYDRNWLAQPRLEINEQYFAFTKASNAESVGLFGALNDGDGFYPLWALAQDRRHNEASAGTLTTFDMAAVVSGLLQFYVDRFAFAVTRFTFDTGGIAHGIGPGSVAQVRFAVSRLDTRTVVGEVESIKVSPIDGNTFQLVIRSVATPAAGSEPLFTWADAFGAGEKWVDIFSAMQRWSQIWTEGGS